MHKPNRRKALVASTCAIALVGGGVAAAAIATSTDPRPEPNAIAESPEPDAESQPATKDDAQDTANDKAHDKATDPSEGTGLSTGAVTAAATKASVDPKVVADATTTVDATLDSFYAPLKKGEEPNIPNVGKTLADEIEIAQYERQDAGWTVTGSPTLDELEVVKVDRPAKPTAMTIRVCVDTSDVTIKNSTGRDMTTKTATRSRSVFKMNLVDGEWRTTSRSLAANADCSA